MLRYLLTLAAVSLASCSTTPVLTESLLSSMDDPTLCHTVGRAFALNDANGFHLAIAEVSKRDNPVQECIALAQMGVNSVAADAARRQAMAAAWASGMAQMQKAFQTPTVVQPVPVNRPVNTSCTTYGDTTNCQSR